MTTKRLLPLLFTATFACAAEDSAVQTIGPEGGTLEAPSGRMKLVIPPGALSEAVSIHVTPSEPIHGALTSYELEPHGLRFAKPVRLTLRYDEPQDFDEEELVIAEHTKDGELSLFKIDRDIEVDAGADTVSASLLNFSSHLVVRSPCGDDPLCYPRTFYVPLELRIDRETSGSITVAWTRREETLAGVRYAIERAPGTWDGSARDDYYDNEEWCPDPIDSFHEYCLGMCGFSPNFSCGAYFQRVGWSPVVVSSYVDSGLNEGENFTYRIARYGTTDAGMQQNPFARWFAGYSNATTARTIPGVPDPNQTTGAITAVAAGNAHFLALDDRGRVFTWGASKTPVVIPQLINIQTISAGYSHSLAIDDEGIIWAWGDNTYGQLGDGTTISSTIPVAVRDENMPAGAVLATQVAAGEHHSVAIGIDGSIHAWGRNQRLQLGEHFGEQVSVARRHPYLSGMMQLASGWNHVLVAGGQSSAVWGDNSRGQLGIASMETSPTAPGAFANLGVTQLAAGAEHSLALIGATGVVIGWGSNEFGQLGPNAPQETTAAVVIGGLPKIVRVAAGRRWSLALDEQGRVWSVGEGQQPQTIPGISGATAIAAGADCGLAIVAGEVWVWEARSPAPEKVAF